MRGKSLDTHCREMPFLNPTRYGMVTCHELWRLDPGSDRLIWPGIPRRCQAKIADKGISYELPAMREDVC